MANEVQIKFKIKNLETTMTVEQISLKEKKSAKAYSIPKSDGAIAETGKRGPLTITVEGKIYADNYDTLRVNIDNLKSELQNGVQKFTIDDDRYVTAQLLDFTEDKPRESFPTVADYRASFIAHNPFWLSETFNFDSAVRTSGVGFTINNAGNAPARVKVIVTAPGGGIADNIQVENTTRGEILRYRGTVAAAETLEIDNRVDTDEFEVLNDAVDDVANFEGDFLNLSPGNNTIEYTGVAGTTVAIYWHDTWY